MDKIKIRVHIIEELDLKEKVRTLSNKLKYFDLSLLPVPDGEDFIINLERNHSLLPLVERLVEELNELVEQRDAAEELQAILQSAIEGIEAVDIQGTIKYVNPAFLKITGIPAEERIGQNIFHKNPDGLLTQVLKYRKPIHHVMTRAPGSGAEVIASATPVFRDGVMTGAVVLVSDISNTIKVAKELEKSKSFLDSLLNKIGNSNHSFVEFIGNSEPFKKTLEHAKMYAQSNSTVLILGESGVGKELFAQAIHNFHNQKGPFIPVNCAAIPSNLLESELFGHEKGAFTGADRRRIGMFELAQNGTIFLDEIGDLDYHLQGKLLRVLQQNEFRRVGGNEIIHTNARVIAATNRSLERMMSEGKFREDLFYRLHVLPLRIPPLRERKEDIPSLVDFFINKFNRKIGKNVLGVKEEGQKILHSYHWPGNVRELENVIERAVNIAEGHWLTKETLFFIAQSSESEEVKPEIMPLVEMEKVMIQNALNTFGKSLNGKKMAAKALGISLASLYNKIKIYRLEEEQDYHF